MTQNIPYSFYRNAISRFSTAEKYFDVRDVAFAHFLLLKKIERFPDKLSWANDVINNEKKLAIFIKQACDISTSMQQKAGASGQQITEEEIQEIQSESLKIYLDSNRQLTNQILTLNEKLDDTKADSKKTHKRLDETNSKLSKLTGRLIVSEQNYSDAQRKLQDTGKALDQTTQSLTTTTASLGKLTEQLEKERDERNKEKEARMEAEKKNEFLSKYGIVFTIIGAIGSNVGVVIGLLLAPGGISPFGLLVAVGTGVGTAIGATAIYYKYIRKYRIKAADAKAIKDQTQDGDKPVNVLAPTPKPDLAVSPTPAANKSASTSTTVEATSNILKQEALVLPTPHSTMSLQKKASFENQSNNLDVGGNVRPPIRKNSDLGKDDHPQP